MPPTVRRRLPGDGRRNPVRHVVTIVVVRPSRGSKSALRRDGSVQSHDLTAGQLRAGAAALKKMDAPPSSNVSPGPSSVTTTKPKKMFDVLQPTDIVVIGRKPASLLTVDSSGGRASRRLFAHDDGNRHAVLRVFTDSDTIEYQCEEKFEIVRVEKAGWKIYGTADNPFRGRLPYKAKRTESAGGGRSLWVWTSKKLKLAANNQQYKATFRIGRKLIDPDVVCGDPPPN